MASRMTGLWDKVCSYCKVKKKPRRVVKERSIVYAAPHKVLRTHIAPIKKTVHRAYL